MEKSPVENAVQVEEMTNNDLHNFERVSRFLDVINTIQPSETSGKQLYELAWTFLEIMEGQSLAIIHKSPHEMALIPKLAIGKYIEIIGTSHYNKNDSAIQTVLKADQPVVFSADDNFADSPLLQQLSKTMKFKMVLGSPIKADPQEDNLILMFSNKERDVYRESDFKLIGVFSRVLALMTRSSKLTKSVERQSKEMASRDFDLFTVYQVSKALSSIIDIEELTNMLTDMLVEVLTVESSVVLLTNEQEEKIRIKASKHIDPILTNPEMSISISERSVEWLSNQTYESKVITEFDDPEFVNAFPGADRVMNELGVVLAVPMIYKHKLVGFLGLGRKYVGQAFQKRDYDFVTTIAPLAANAISNAHLYELAILDGLTKVYLGRYFQQRCKEEIKRAGRYKQVLSVVMWDIDHFKDVNDTYGHVAGDVVLRELAKIFKQSYRQGIDLIARYGGEEFVMLLPDTPAEGAFIMAERIRQTVEEHPFCEGKVKITISGGIATFPGCSEDYLSLIEKADLQLYRAKRAGRNLVYFNAIGEENE